MGCNVSFHLPDATIANVIEDALDGMLLPFPAFRVWYPVAGGFARYILSNRRPSHTVQQGQQAESVRKMQLLASNNTSQIQRRGREYSSLSPQGDRH